MVSSSLYCWCGGTIFTFTFFPLATQLCFAIFLTLLFNTFQINIVYSRLDSCLSLNESLCVMWKRSPAIETLVYDQTRLTYSYGNH